MRYRKAEPSPIQSAFSRFEAYNATKEAELERAERKMVQ